MRTRDRFATVLLSLVLPALSFALLLAFTVGTVMLATHDRAIVWAEGTPAQLDEMQHRVSSNPWFGHGRTERASTGKRLPPACSSIAREFSFGSLGGTEGQAARQILELIAAEAGARVCLTNTFIINELPDPADQTWLQAAASMILSASLLPCATLILVYAVLAERLGLAQVPGDSGHWGSALGWGVVTGAVMSLVLVVGTIVENGGPPANAMTAGNIGYPLAFALVVAVPVMEELAFRGWLIPLAQRGIGAVPAAALSSVVFAAANVPADVWSALDYLALGALLSALFLRTRSLLACLVAHVQVSACLFWLA